MMTAGSQRGKCSLPSLRAPARVPGRDRLGRRAAPRAEAGDLMPVRQRDRVRQEPGVAVVQQVPGLAQARAADAGVVSGLRRGRGDAEVGDLTGIDAEQEPDAFRRLTGRDEDQFGGVPAGRLPDQRLALLDDNDPGGGAGPGRFEPVGIRAQLRRPFHLEPGQRNRARHGNPGASHCPRIRRFRPAAGSGHCRSAQGAHFPTAPMLAA